jgi:hypothetical protein
MDIVTQDASAPRRAQTDNDDQELAFTEIGVGLLPPPYTTIPRQFYWYGQHLLLAARECYQLLCYHRQADGDIFPSWPTLMHEGNMSKDQVWDGLDELEHFNWIKRIERYDERNGRTSNKYILYFPNKLWPDPENAAFYEAYEQPSKQRAPRRRKKQDPTPAIPDEVDTVF